MRLGWYDRMGGPLYILPRLGEKRVDLFDKESKTDYVKRFFKEIRGLGNCGIVLIKGNKQRELNLRGF